MNVSNFDTVFTAEEPTDGVVEGSQLSQTVQAQFVGPWFLSFGFGFTLMCWKSGFSHDGTNMPASPGTLPPAFHTRIANLPLSVYFPQTKMAQPKVILRFVFFL